MRTGAETEGERNSAQATIGATDFLSDDGEIATALRSRDWSGSSIGAPDHWPRSLKTVVRIMLSSRYAIWIGWGPDLTFLYNDAYRAMTLGKKHPWALGRPAREVWAEAWHDLGPRVEEVVRRGRATYDEHLLLLLERSGYAEETYHTFSYSPLPDDDGHVGGLLSIVVEDTERYIAERRLKVLREVAAEIANTRTIEGLCDATSKCLGSNLHDLPFTLIYLTESDGRSLRLACGTGFSSDEHPAAPQIIEADRHSDAWPVRQALSEGRTLVIDDLASRFRHLPTGAWDKPPHSAVLVPIVPHSQAQPAGVMIVGANPYRPLDDIYRGFIALLSGQIAAALADAHAFEEEKKRAEALAELDRAKTIFFSNVSHEFRTPLTLILSPLEEMLVNSFGSHSITLARDEIETVHRNALRLLKLVNTLLDFSRIEAGRAQASYEPLDLSSYTAELASSFRSAMDRAGLKFEIDCRPLPDPVYVDRDMWEKVVLNLISNALKYTLAGTVTVSVCASSDRKYARLLVTDTGVGIPERELPRLFERFHRIEGQAGRTQEGTGIGLALVQELVKLHSGNVNVDSAVGRGSTFAVSIPVGSKHLPAERIGERKLLPTQLRAEIFVEEALRWLGDTRPIEFAFGQEFTTQLIAATALQQKPQVLVADDNVDMREYITRLLSVRFNVRTVADGRELLQAARTHRPDVILSDVMMPGLDGFALLRELRGDPELRTVPVLLLSARAGEESRIEGLDAGADEYLVKPFSGRELIAHVESMVKMALLRRDNEKVLRQAHDELRSSNQRLRGEVAQRARIEESLRESDRLKNEFLALLGHELRNPLAPIYSTSEILSRTLAENPQAQAGVAIIQRQTKQLIRMVDDLLDVARISQGHIALRRQTIDLSSVVAQGVETVGPLLIEKSHQLSIESGFRPLYVSGDADRLAQCVSNLVSNAAKYTDPGGRIRIEVRAEGPFAVIEITDNGSGIPDTLLPRIFELFIQGDQTLDRAQGGLGIGLPVVKRLVEMHGGNVSARSSGVGKGASFEIRLPQVTPMAADLAKTTSIKVPPRRIFIVDDNADAAESLATLLQLDGHEVQTACSSKDALERMESFKPDVALLDIGLPEMNGYELMRRLQEVPALQAVRFIAVTGYGRIEDRERIRQAGFEGHLVKPVSIAALNRVLPAQADFPQPAGPRDQRTCGVE